MLVPELRLAGRLLPLDRPVGLRVEVRDFGTLIEERGVAEPEPDTPVIPADEPAMAMSPVSIMPAEAGVLVEALLDPVLAEVLDPVLVDPVLRADVERAVLALVDPARADVVRRAVDLPEVDLAEVPVERAVALRVVPVRDVPDLVERVAGRVVPPDALAAGLRLVVLRDRAVVPAALTTVFTDPIDLAAAVRALAAVCMALVAVFIDFIADDIVCADAVALVAAAVILVAADVTLVAADETPLAADAGVELRPDVVLRVLLAAVLRVAELRLAVVVRARVAEGRDADVVPRDLAVVLRAELVVLLVGRAAELRVVLVPVEVLELDVDLGRLAVPLDALRLADLRAVLAVLRRVAARVVDCTGTDLPPS